MDGTAGLPPRQPPRDAFGDLRRGSERGADPEMRRARVQRTPLREQRLGVPPQGADRRAPPSDATAQRRPWRLQVNDRAGAPHQGRVCAQAHRSAADSDHRVAKARRAGQRAGFPLPKSRLAFRRENGAHGLSRGANDLPVQIQKGAAEPPCQNHPDRRLAASHEPHQENQPRRLRHRATRPHARGVLRGNRPQI